MESDFIRTPSDSPGAGGDLERRAPNDVLPEDARNERRRSNICKPTSVHNVFTDFREDPNCDVCKMTKTVLINESE